MNQRTKEIIDILSSIYPNPVSELKFNSPFELLISVILSAQCTDKRVNLVTDKLFKTANTPIQFVNMSIDELEHYIHSCGFYHVKAQHIKQASYDIVTKFNGCVPRDFDSLVQLSGVGRKTANVVMAIAFDTPAIAVDTHVYRVSNRLALVNANNVYDCEMQLCKQIDKQLWSASHHYLLLFGRYICKSQRPGCSNCLLKKYCIYDKKEQT